MTISAGIANSFTFVGQYGVSSDGSGLIYMRARYYDPSTGQFLSSDPLGTAAEGHQPRRYVGNRRRANIDPAGTTDANATPIQPDQRSSGYIQIRLLAIGFTATYGRRDDGNIPLEPRL